MIGYGVVGVFLISTDARALWMFPIVLLSGLGNGIVNAVLPAFVSESVPVEKSGMALGIQQVIKMATQAVGQQVVAALLIVFPRGWATASSTRCSRRSCRSRSRSRSPGWHWASSR